MQRQELELLVKNLRSLGSSPSSSSLPIPTLPAPQIPAQKKSASMCRGMPAFAALLRINTAIMHRGVLFPCCFANDGGGGDDGGNPTFLTMFSTSFLARSSSACRSLKNHHPHALST